MIAPTTGGNTTKPGPGDIWPITEAVDDELTALIFKECTIASKKNLGYRISEGGYKMATIICPKCGAENSDSVMNCT